MHILSNDYEANVPNAPYPAQGGPARFSSRLVKALLAGKHSYTGVVTVNTEDKAPTMEPIGTKGASNYYRLHFPKTLYNAVAKSKTVKKPEITLAPIVECFQEIIKKENIDLVFINGFGLRVWPLLIAAHRENIPVVQKHAGIWHKELDIYEDFYTKNGIKIMKGMERDITKYASKQVFLNTYSENVFQKEISKSPKSKRMIIPLPTPFRAIKKRTKKKKDTQINIGVVARWDRIKNHQAILAVAEELYKQKVPAKIHVITRVPNTPKDAHMKKRYHDLIEIHPTTDAKGILAFYRGMDIAILPSHFDVSPTVVLEAASQGTGTIISPNVGWVNHYRQTGNTQWIGDFTKPKSIVKKIQKLADHSLSNELLKKFKLEHESKNVFPKYIRLFKSLT
ncbi:MAG: glycosyltransferase family 4 protein [Candidatus Magasanikbacteria bacterium]|nr:glycosyltransferase family 4 protein [Candidatus Magasanikbacteria bacterium]MCA9391412.1 glycosyltransferase family 4 protein [Candidatus Magasanikbacteria bacterium]HPF95474.1 glycosyltransferase family 4 protein [bacterium]